MCGIVLPTGYESIDLVLILWEEILWEEALSFLTSCAFILKPPLHR